MAVQDLTFPQSADKDDAEFFAALIGQANISDFVEQGYGFSYDNAVPEVTVGQGKAFISQSQGTASSSGEDVLNLNYVVQNTSETVSLTDNDVNYIYINPQFTSDDSAVIESHTSQQGGDLMLIGEIDTSNDTVTEYNRLPDIDVNEFGGAGDPISVQDIIDVNSNDIEDDGTTLWDTSNQYIPQGRLENDFVTISTRDGLQTGGNVSLGGSVDLNIDVSDFAGTSLRDDGSENLELYIEDILDLNSNDLTDDGTTLWDTSNQYIPQSRLEHDSLTVSAGDGLKTGGSVSLNSSVTLDIDVSDFAGAGLSDDGNNDLQVDSIYTDEKAQDAVGTILGSLFTYDDAGNSITLDEGEIDHDAIDQSTVNANDHHNEDHASRHYDGGADELDASDLAGSSADNRDVLTSDGSAASWENPQDNQELLIHNEGFAPNFGG